MRDRLTLRIAGILIDEVPLVDDENTRHQMKIWRHKYDLQNVGDWEIHKVLQSRFDGKTKTDYERAKTIAES